MLNFFLTLFLHKSIRRTISLLDAFLSFMIKFACLNEMQAPPIRFPLSAHFSISFPAGTEEKFLKVLPPHLPKGCFSCLFSREKIKVESKAFLSHSGKENFAERMV